jgi:hypothetical protein
MRPTKWPLSVVSVSPTGRPALLLPVAPFRRHVMKVVLIFFVWCLLLVLCWPLALLALILAPLVWLVALPFRVAGICLGAVLSLVRALLYLPSRLLWPRGGAQ